MTYPPVTQFETRALKAKAQARLAREQRGARTPKRPISGQLAFLRPTGAWSGRLNG
jgi:hypothetical protein